jgi:hypothetical protein
MELLPWIDETKLDWEILSRNPNAIKFLRENPDKINWNRLSQNPNSAIGKTDIIWNGLSQNPNAIELLKENLIKLIGNGCLKIQMQ